MKAHFELLSEYNAWANERLYRTASTLGEADVARDVGAYFKSLLGTLNHLLVADRIWLSRLTGEGTPPSRLDETLFGQLAPLWEARRVEDTRLTGFVKALDEARVDETLHYRTLGGVTQSERVGLVLTHVFNHQTHHRGQAHHILTALGIAEPPPLDLLVMLRERRSA
jgi:uncharacterized damage-inducible protein DinB